MADSTSKCNEVVGVFVLVPNELAFDFDNHEIVTVELAHRPWLPVLGERG